MLTRLLLSPQEYYQGGDLLEYVLTRGPMRARPALGVWVLNNVGTALSYMKTMGVFHGDVKPENLLFEHPVAPADNNTSSAHEQFPAVRLIDFGHAQYLCAEKRTVGMFGTLEYSAPEVHARAVKELVDGAAADVWSLGVTLHALLFGSLPWAEPSIANKEFAAFTQRYAAMYPPAAHPPASAANDDAGSDLTYERRAGAVFDDAVVSTLGISASLCELLDRMLCPDPAQRWTIEQVLASDLLGQPWFCGSEGHQSLVPEACVSDTQGEAAELLSATASVEVLT